MSKFGPPSKTNYDSARSASGDEEKTAQTGTDGKFTKKKLRKRSPKKATAANYEKEAAARQRMLAKTQRVNVDDVLRSFVIKEKLGARNKQEETGLGYKERMARLREQKRAS